MHVLQANNHPHLGQNADPSFFDPSQLTRDEKRVSGWKFQGYPLFAKWMGSSNDFCVVRRFTQLGARALLRLQDEIVELESRLEELDNISMKDPSTYGRLNSFRFDQEQELERDSCMEELTTKLKEYYGFLEAFTSVRNRQGAHEYQIKNVKTWLENNLGSVDSDESTFTQKEGDAIALVARPKSLLRQGLEKVALVRWLFRLRKRDDRVQADSTTYYSERWVEICAAAAVLTTGLALLLGPMWALELMRRSLDKLTIITVFVVVFAILLFCSTTSERQTSTFEVLAATAAYAAVLAVFLQVNEPT